MLKIIQLTDIHLSANNSNILFGIDTYSNMKKITDCINQIKDVDCIIITGDIANNGNYEAYICLDRLLDLIQLPIYWLQGNHDFSEVMLQVSTKVKIKSDKLFKIKDTKFILLQSIMRDEDNLSLNKGRGYLFDYEISFLKRELESDNYESCIIALHHPPIKSHSWTDGRMLTNYDEFIPLIEKYPKVKVVLYGHQHIAQKTILNGINYISSPPTSYYYDRNGKKFSLIKDKRGFGVIIIFDDNTIMSEFMYI